MLTALVNQKTIYIEAFEPKKWKELSATHNLHCPDCGAALVFKECHNRTSHFAHAQRDCTYPFREPESIEHEQGKKALYEWLQAQFKTDDCSIEHHLKETNQRADTFVHSIQSAVEFQCSVIQSSTWETRHTLYEQANVQDLWILGYSMHKRYEHHRFLHKLNPLETTLATLYKKVMYFDVLTHQFIFLYPEYTTKQGVFGVEYRFKPSEVMLQNGTLQSKYDYFLQMQQTRAKFGLEKQAQAKQTDTYLHTLRQKAVNAKPILASKKQINYIKFLLHQEGKTIPYKLHGLKKEEADAIIKKLIETKKNIQ